MSLFEKAIVAGVLALVAVGGWWKLTEHYEAKGYDRAQAEGRASAEAQAESNRELMRRAELRYTVQAVAREKFIVQTITEIRHETGNLAACVLSPRAVQLLNDTAACVRGDRPAACAPDTGLPDAR